MLWLIDWLFRFCLLPTELSFAILDNASQILAPYTGTRGLSNGSIKVDAVTVDGNLPAGYAAGTVTANIPTNDGTFVLELNVDYIITFRAIVSQLG
jgi:hypothetical protein